MKSGGTRAVQKGAKKALPLIITNSKAKKKGAHFEHLNYHLLSILIVVYHDLFSVPFMADTVGTWKVGGMDEWNEIVYHNGIIDQLGEFDDGDTIIYINSPTPQKNLQETDTNRQGFLCENKVIF